MIETKRLNDIFTEELDKQFNNNKEYSKLKNSYEINLLSLSIAKDLNVVDSVKHFEEILQNIENKVKKNYVIDTMNSNKVNFLATTLYSKDFVLKVAMSNNRSLTTTIKTLSKLYKDCLNSDRIRIEQDIQNFVNSIVRA